VKGRTQAEGYRERGAEEGIEPQRRKVRLDSRKMYYEELYILYCSLDIVRGEHINP